ncbi:predicted protein [Histoplasma capsulatum H143]|uniref:Uncharacterized protein n=1 Tax=Ajellomyces capsulatus (strain H143) TaxID=544712 RepID=C6H9R0_AJECH|nr:predicted protein [Histoplasma capsulatum H143]
MARDCDIVDLRRSFGVSIVALIMNSSDCCHFHPDRILWRSTRGNERRYLDPLDCCRPWTMTTEILHQLDKQSQFSNRRPCRMIGFRLSINLLCDSELRTEYLSCGMIQGLIAEKASQLFQWARRYGNVFGLPTI